MGLVALWHVRSSRIRGQTCLSCTGRWILSQDPPGRPPINSLLNVYRFRDVKGVYPRFHSQVVAELGLELGSLECKIDSAFWRAGLFSDTVPLAEAARSRLGPLPASQRLELRPRWEARGLKQLPKGKLRRYCIEWDRVWVTG